MTSLAATQAPHNTEAEQTTLGAILVDPDKMIDVAPVLSADDFFEPVHAAICGAMQQLYEHRTPIDFVTICNTLGDHPAIQQIGGSAFLADLAANVPAAANAQHYAEIVREKSLRRKISKTGKRLADIAAGHDKSAAELLEFAEQQVLSLSRQSSHAKPRSLMEIAPERYEHYAELHDAADPAACHGIATGFTSLDNLLAGLKPGHFMVLAARPSVGKTALALNIARNVAVQGEKSVTVFSLEMTTDEVADRLFANLLGVDAWRLRRGNLTDAQYRDMGASFDSLADHRIFIDDDPDTSLVNLRSKARRQQLEHGMDLLVIDYLQLIQVTGQAASENQTQRITYISNGLKQLARELQCPVIVLSQLSRSCEQRVDKRPILSDLRDSGSIEQDADSVLMLYRESYYNEDCADPEMTDLYLRKNRHGPIGHVQLRFNTQLQQFTSPDVS